MTTVGRVTELDWREAVMDETFGVAGDGGSEGEPSHDAAETALSAADGLHIWACCFAALGVAGLVGGIWAYWQLGALGAGFTAAGLASFVSGLFAFAVLRAGAALLVTIADIARNVRHGAGLTQAAPAGSDQR